MKNFKKYILLPLVLITGSLFGQETCKVSLVSISGKYEGQCKKGKADGEGTAEGIDKYTGTFKDGLPSGKGTYYWKNGDSYSGEWLKGKMEGQGTKTIKRNGKADSIVNGFWKKDIYAGKYEKPYIISAQTNQIARIEVRKISQDQINNITIELSNTSGGVPSLGVSAIGNKASLSDIIILSGAYLRTVNMNDGPKGTTLKLLEVTFPFKARYKIGAQEMTIEILEPGDWLINAFLNN